MKIVLQARDENHLRTLRQYLRSQDIHTTSIFIDNPSRDMLRHAPTAFATQIIDKDDPEMEKLFSEFHLYTDEPHEPREWIFFLFGSVIGVLLTTLETIL